MKILLVYASEGGSTKEVAEFIGARLTDNHLDVDVMEATTVMDVSMYDAFIFGTGIYKGLFGSPLLMFLKKFRKAITNKPVFWFVLCIRILEQNSYAHILQHYIPPVLKKYNVIGHQIFAGKIRIDEIDLADRWTLALHYDGVNKPNELNQDFRDWDAIAKWCDDVMVQLSARIPKVVID